MADWMDDGLEITGGLSRKSGRDQAWRGGGMRSSRPPHPITARWRWLLRCAQHSSSP